MFLSNDDGRPVAFARPIAVRKAVEWKIGDFAEWDSSGGTARGRIERIEREGSINVPNSSFTVRAEEDDPAVLLRIHRQFGEGWRATPTLVGHKASTLSKIEPLKVVKAVEDAPSLLRHLLSDVFSLYFLAHAAHWNVRGADFAQYHELFSEIYEDIEGSIDPLAENILKTGGMAPQNLTELQMLRTVMDPMDGDTPAGLAQVVADLNDQVLARLNDAFIRLDQMGEQGVADFIAGRIDAHQKWRWQLRASLGQPVVR